MAVAVAGVGAGAVAGTEAVAVAVAGVGAEVGAGLGAEVGVSAADGPPQAELVEDLGRLGGQIAEGDAEDQRLGEAAH